ncbi:MAG: outer membrane beta-barrel protein [Halioglobus sp.]
MKPILLPVCSALLLILQTTTALAATGEVEQPSIQVFLGVLELDDQTAQWNNNAGDEVNVDFSSLPIGGIEAEYILGRGWVHWGLNPGGSIAWKNDNTQVAGSLTEQNGGTLLVNIDNSLLLTELHLGAYVRGRLNERVTTYAAAGPMVMYGTLDVNNNNSSDSQSPDGSAAIPDDNSSDINLGYYARVGIDFSIGNQQQLGLGLRYLSSELDFDKTVGKVDLKGPQYVLTYSVQL